MGMKNEKYVTLLDIKNLLPISCIVSGGEILPALVAEASDRKIPSSLCALGYSHSIGLYMAVAEDGIYYTVDGGKFYQISSNSYSNSFFVEEISDEKARCAVVCGSTVIICDGTSFFGAKLDNELLCGVMHRGRLFSADYNNRLKLYWSGQGGLLDQTDGIYKGGHLYLPPERGNILNLVEYDEKIVIVREYGLTIFSANGNPENYSLYLSDTDCDKVFGGTAVALNGYMYFYTSGGLCTFDGDDIKRVSHNLTDDVESPMFAVAYGDMYILSCKSKKLERNVVFVYNTTSEFGYYVDIEAKVMYISDCVHICNDSGDFALKEGNSWSLTGSGVNFGTGKNCTLTEAYVGGNALLEIDNGRNTRKFSCAFSSVFPRFRGREFTIKLTGEGKALSIKLKGDATFGI
jgi:hypothetical protein